MPILNSAYFTECRRHIVIPCSKVCRIKNWHTFRILPILNSAYFKSMPILNSSYHAVKYAELRIGSILKVCRFVIRHITQTETQTETEANFTHPQTKIATVMFLQVSVCPRGGGVCGRGACVAGGVHGGGHAWQILRDTVNERAVRILLECILVLR